MGTSLTTMPGGRLASISMLDLHRLRALLAVREHGGIPAAARALSLVPAEVDDLVSGLERQLNLPLLDGEPRGMRLTSAGQQLATHTQRVLAELEAAEAEAAAAIGRIAGMVRVGVTPAAARALLPDALARVWETAPDVEVRVEQLGTDESLAGIAAGTLDVAVVGEYGMVPRQLDPSLERRDLLVEPVLVAVPARHPAQGPTVRLAELGRDRWIGAAVDSPGLELLHRGCGVAGVEPTVIAHCADESLALTLVAAGMGLALVPASAADQHGGPDRRLEGVRLLTPVDPSLRRTVTAVARRSGVSDPAIGRLLDSLSTAGRRFVDVTPGASRPVPPGLGAEPGAAPGAPPAGPRPAAAAERNGNGNGHPAILPPPGGARPTGNRPGTPVSGRGPIEVPGRSPYSGSPELPPGHNGSNGTGELPPLRPVAGGLSGRGGPADVPGLPPVAGPNGNGIPHSRPNGLPNGVPGGNDLPPLRPIAGGLPSRGGPAGTGPLDAPFGGPNGHGLPPHGLPHGNGPADIPGLPGRNGHSAGPGELPPLRPVPPIPAAGPADLPPPGDLPPLRGGDLPPLRPPAPPSRNDLASLGHDLPVRPERSGNDLPLRPPGLPPQPELPEIRPVDRPMDRPGDMPSRRRPGGLSGAAMFRATGDGGDAIPTSSDLGARSLPAADLPIPRSPGDAPRRPGAGPTGTAPPGRRPGAPDLSRRTRAESRAARSGVADGTLPPAPDQDVRLSIFEELQSEWFSRRSKSDPLGGGSSGDQSQWGSPADDGWRAAARLAAPTTAGTTTAGLPKRVPQALYVPGAVGGDQPRPNGAPNRSPQDVRGRLSSYRDGVRRGRHAERPPGEDDQPLH
jgi:DNA-binding transcriptional LysR family regulator